LGHRWAEMKDLGRPVWKSLGEGGGLSEGPQSGRKELRCFGGFCGAWRLIGCEEEEGDPGSFWVCGLSCEDGRKRILREDDFGLDCGEFGGSWDCPAVRSRHLKGQSQRFPAFGGDDCGDS
jgi:hypothetical protein